MWWTDTQVSIQSLESKQNPRDKQVIGGESRKLKIRYGRFCVIKYKKYSEYNKAGEGSMDQW